MSMDAWLWNKGFVFDNSLDKSCLETTPEELLEDLAERFPGRIAKPDDFAEDRPFIDFGSLDEREDDKDYFTMSFQEHSDGGFTVWLGEFPVGGIESTRVMAYLCKTYNLEMMSFDAIVWHYYDDDRLVRVATMQGEDDPIDHRHDRDLEFLP